MLSLPQMELHEASVRLYSGCRLACESSDPHKRENVELITKIKVPRQGPDEISIDTQQAFYSRQAVKHPRVILDDLLVLRGADAAAIF